MAADVAAAVLLGAGAALALVACPGVVAMRGPYDRVPFAGPAMLAVPCVPLAILGEERFSLIATKALLVAGIVLLTSPVRSRVSARAIRIREIGDWAVEPEDRVEVEEG